MERSRSPLIWTDKGKNTTLTTIKYVLISNTVYNEQQTFCNKQRVCVTNLASVDKAEHQSSDFSRKDQHDDQKELERKENQVSYWEIREKNRMKTQ